MPINAALSTNGKIRIPVPRQFRDYLIANKDRRFAYGLSLYTLLVLFFGFVLHWSFFWDAGAILFLIIDLISWQFQRRKPWNYVIDKEHMTVIWLQHGERYWNWFEIYWKRVTVTGIEETEWRGLPAMRLLLEVKNPKRRPDWLIVYAHEDADMVRTQILPLIEQYRRQYRTPILTDKLRDG